SHRHCYGSRPDSHYSRWPVLCVHSLDRRRRTLRRGRSAVKMITDREHTKHVEAQRRKAPSSNWDKLWFRVRPSHRILLMPKARKLPPKPILMIGKMVFFRVL